MTFFDYFFKSTTESSSGSHNLELKKSKIRPAGPAPPAKKGISNRLALGAGCYWGTEKFVWKHFQEKFPGSIQTTKVGFMSPFLEGGIRIRNPTYEQVCTGQTGLVEVLYIELTNPEKHFEELIRFFFQFHDPTTQNRQGNDVGFQYASCIFCDNDVVVVVDDDDDHNKKNSRQQSQQFQIAEKVRDELQELLDAQALNHVYGRDEVTTIVTKLKQFTPAHAGHQKYLEKNPIGYCNHRIRFKIWPALIEKPTYNESSRNSDMVSDDEEEDAAVFGRGGGGRRAITARQRVYR